jgi:hypothetical protein
MYYFLGTCLVLDDLPHKRQEVLEQITKPEFPWEQFVQAGSSHLVLPAIYTKFRDGQLLSYLPDELNIHLEKIYELNIQRNKRLLTQIRGLHNLLNKSGIQALFLKGSGALLGELYNDPGERLLSDIDLLVRGTDFQRAVQVVKDAGYTHPPFLAEKLHLMHHFPSLFKPGEAAKVEIHKIPVGVRQLKYLNPEGLWSCSFQPQKGNGPRILSGPDQILINLLHSQLKDRGQYYANIPLRNIYEFYKLTRRYKLSGMNSSQPRMKRVLNKYMAVAEKLFTPSEPLPLENSISSKLFLWRFERNKSSRNYHRIGKFTRSLIDLLSTYLYILSNAVVRKEYRTYLRINLTSTSWYRHHWSVVKKRFRTAQ